MQVKLSDQAFTYQQVESALDTNRLSVQWRNGTWHAVRRNGRTKLFKRDNARFIIPCKTGFRDCFQIAAYDTDGHLLLNSPSLAID
jgi:hypothetical protein